MHLLLPSKVRCSSRISTALTPKKLSEDEACSSLPHVPGTFPTPFPSQHCRDTKPHLPNPHCFRGK